MNPDLEAALAHQLVRKHRAVAHLAGEQERLERAVAKHEQHRQAAEEHQGRLAAWRRACEQAVADGADQPPKPAAPDYDLGQAQHVITQQRQALVDAARSALADAAPDLVVQLASECDKALAVTAKGQVQTLDRQLVALGQLRAVLVAVAKTRWPHDVTGYAVLDRGLLADLAIDGQGSHRRDWDAFLAAQQRRVEAEATAAAEMAQLAAKAAERQGQLVSEGMGSSEPLPVELVRVPIGRR